MRDREERIIQQERSVGTRKRQWHRKAHTQTKKQIKNQ